MIPEEWHGKKVAAFVAVSAGPVDEGEALVRPFRAVAEPIADLLGPMPYRVIQTLLDPLWPKGIHAYFKATNLARLDDALIDRLCEVHLAGARAAVRDPRPSDGRRGRPGSPTGATAFAERSMPFVLNAVTGWHDAARRRRRTPRLGSQGDRRRLERVHRPRVRELPRRQRRGTVVLRRGNVRPAGRAEERATTRRTSSGSTRTSSRTREMARGREPGGSAATRYVRVRPLRHGEARTIMRVFERLSERSRRLRFNGPKPYLRAAELRELASVDGHQISPAPES